jgi:kynurenine formamidase
VRGCRKLGLPRRETDERGALHHLTPARVVAAARPVRDGLSVSMSFPADTAAAAHNPRPATHQITRLPDHDADPGSLGFAMDCVGFDYHSDTHTHLAALRHVAFNGSLYNGQPCQQVTFEGAAVGSVETLRDGLVGRGVLLDVPRLRGVTWLEPGEHVFGDELEAAERAQGVTVGQGDILLIRTGHARRLAEFGPWETAGAKAGLHPTAMPFVAERRVAALGSDGNSDTAPSTTEGVPFPIHVLAINAMGVHLLDYLQLEDLRLACEVRLARLPELLLGGHRQWGLRRLLAQDGLGAEWVDTYTRQGAGGRARRHSRDRARRMEQPEPGPSAGWPGTRPSSSSSSGRRHRLCPAEGTWRRNPAGIGTGRRPPEAARRRLPPGTEHGSRREEPHRRETLGNRGRCSRFRRPDAIPRRLPCLE